MKNKLRLLSLLLVVVMMTTLAPAALAENAEDKPYLEITLYSDIDQANYTGMQSGWVGKILKDKFNIGVNLVHYDNTKFATSMASGNIGDVIVFSNVNNDNFRAAMDLGMLYDWDTNGNAEKYAPYITAHYPGARERSESQWGGFYGMGHEVHDVSLGLGGNVTGGPSLRYDLYKAVGAPEAVEQDDLLPVIKEMLALYPVNEDGLPVYGVSYWNDKGLLYPGSMYANHYGYMNYGLVYWHGLEDKAEDLLAADSHYMKGIRFAYEANQMGILDPDSISQTWDDVFNKMKTGRILYVDSAKFSESFNTAEKAALGQSMQVVPFKNDTMFDFAANPYGGNIFIAITKNAQSPERIMEMLDWTYTDEGIMTLTNGPRGLVWELDENNKPYLTEFGYECIANPETEMPEEYGGGTYTSGSWKFGRYNRHTSGLTELTGEGAKNSVWSSYLAATMSEPKKEWVEDHGGEVSYYKWLEENGHIIISPNEVVVSITSVPAESFEIQQIRNTVTSVINEYCWKMVYAENMDQYNALYEEMVTKAKGLGYDQVVAYNMECIELLNAARHEMYD